MKTIADVLAAHLPASAYHLDGDEITVKLQNAAFIRRRLRDAGLRGFRLYTF